MSLHLSSSPFAPSDSEVVDRDQPSMTTHDILRLSRVDAEPFLGTLLQHCRAYLLQIANSEMPAELSVHVAPSDVVQETFVEAFRAFRQFRGSTDAELRSWLRRMLLHNIADARRYFFETQKRQMAKVIPLHCANAPSRSAQLVDPGSSPSSIVQKKEILAKLREAIDRLPENYRLVMRLRHIEGLPLDRVGEQLGRSPSAVRKLWFRGIEKLAELMDHED